MRLASFQYEGIDRIGFELEPGRLVDVQEALSALGHAPLDFTRDMLALVEAGEPALDIVRTARERLRAGEAAVRKIPADEITWHPPVRRPSKICGVAMNNSASDARKISAPDHPLFFLKPASCLVGHLQPIEVREYYGSVHPEPELAVVIGRRCRDVPENRALDVVFGYSILNDMTGNAMRAQDMVHYYALYPAKDDPDRVERVEQHLSYAARYKGTDTFGPMGPWLVTKDEVPNPAALDVTCWHKDEVIAEDSTRYYTYSVERVIAFITRFHSLWPGDVISMGTAFRPSQTGRRSLHLANVTALGGPVRVEISGLGTLENPVRLVEAPAP